MKTKQPDHMNKVSGVNTEDMKTITSKDVHATSTDEAREWEEEFEKEFITYPAALVNKSWGGDIKKVKKTDQLIAIKNSSKQFLTINKLKTFIKKVEDTTRTKTREDCIKLLEEQLGTQGLWRELLTKKK